VINLREQCQEILARLPEAALTEALSDLADLERFWDPSCPCNFVGALQDPIHKDIGESRPVYTARQLAERRTAKLNPVQTRPPIILEE